MLVSPYRMLSWYAIMASSTSTSGKVPPLRRIPSSRLHTSSLMATTLSEPPFSPTTTTFTSDLYQQTSSIALKVDLGNTRLVQEVTKRIRKTGVARAELGEQRGYHGYAPSGYRGRELPFDNSARISEALDQSDCMVDNGEMSMSKREPKMATT